jgi:hypothetical protein
MLVSLPDVSMQPTASGAEGLAFCNEHASGRVFVYQRHGDRPKDLAFGPHMCGLRLELTPQAKLGPVDVYLGAQIPGPMKCDEATMWVYKVVLSICGQYMDDADSLHSSLGDGEDNAHIVVPFHLSDSISHRCSVLDSVDGTEAQVPEQGATYIWDFGSPILDLDNWRVTDLPMFGSLPLERLFGDLPVEFVVYAVPRGQDHRAANLRYLTRIRLSPSTVPPVSGPLIGSTD